MPGAGGVPDSGAGRSSPMKSPFLQVSAAAVLAVIAAAAGTTAAPRSPASTAQPATVDQARLSPAAQARADSGRPPYTAGGLHFLAGGPVHNPPTLGRVGLGAA